MKLQAVDAEYLEERFLVCERGLTRKLVARGRQSVGLRARARERLGAREWERSGEELAERWVVAAGNGAERTWEERSSRYGAMFKAAHAPCFVDHFLCDIF